MGAFSEALAVRPDDSGGTGITIRPTEDSKKESPFAAALANKDASEPPASFADRFGEAPPKKDFSWSQAVTDIPHEISNAAGHAIEGITNLSKRADQGPIEGLLTTGRAALSVPELIASPITGAARSLIGHTMANTEHAVGSVLAPEIAAKDDPEAMYEAGKADTDKAMSALGGKKVPVVAPAVAAPSIQELKASSIAGFHSPEVNNLVLHSDALKEFSQGAQVKLDALGLDDSVAPTTHKILDKMQSAPANSIVTGRNVVSARRSLQNAAKSTEPSERAAAVEAIDHLDDFLPNAGKHVISGDLQKASSTLETARADYSAAMHAETIDKKAIAAELRAAAANSGMNVANTVRQRMADILIKPKEQRGFTKDQLAQMETIVRGTKTQNTVRYAGNLLGGGGGLWAGLLGGGAGYATGGIGALLPAVGYGLKELSNKMTLAQAAKLSESIRAGSPLASSAQKLQAAHTAMGQSRNAKTVAGVVMASRNFSNNLRGIGISIAPNDIARELLQATSGSATENQDSGPRPAGQ